MRTPGPFWEDGEHGSQKLDSRGCCPQCGACFIRIIGLEYCLTCDAPTDEEVDAEIQS